MSLANFTRWTGANSLSKKTYTHNLDTPGSVSSFSITESQAGPDTPVNEFGTLIVVVMKAKNLYNRRAISKQNPFCSVRIATHSDRTQVITRGGQAPVWDHETRFRLSADDNNNHLKLCVFDQNGSNTEIIGDAVIPLHPAYSASVHEGYDNWFPIHYNKRYVGEVYLEMTFYPKKPLKDSRHSSSASMRSTASMRSNSSRPSLQCSAPTRSASPVRSASPMRSSSPMRQTPSFNSMRHSESMPILGQTPSLSPHSSHRRVVGRPLPQLPTETARLDPQPAASSQEDISRLINDGYEAALLEKLRPSGSQPYL